MSLAGLLLRVGVGGFKQIVGVFYVRDTLRSHQNRTQTNSKLLLNYYYIVHVLCACMHGTEHAVYLY